MPTNEMHLSSLTTDPAPGMASDHAASNITPGQFAGALADKSDTELEELLHPLEDELRHGNARSSTRNDVDQILWELERREADRRTQERREANINALREANSESMAGEPGVWVHGRPLDDRERGDLATFIRWVVNGGSG